MKALKAKTRSWLESIKELIPLIFKSIFEKDLLSQSAALSFYCALSLAPFMILTITAFSFFGPTTEVAFIDQVRSTVGTNASEAILMVVEAAKNNKEARGVGSLLGLITLIISASAVFSQLKTSITAIFTDKNSCDVPEKEQSFFDYMKERVFSIGIMISFIFLSLISLMLSAAIPLFLPQEVGEFWLKVNFVISFGIYAFVFYLVFYFGARKKVSQVDAWIGGGISAFLFVCGRAAISFYLTQSALASSYGAAGSLIVLLVWVYYSSFIIFVAGVITKSMSSLRKLKKGAKLAQIQKEILDTTSKDK